MKRSQRMQFLVDLASSRKQTAARELGTKQNMLRLAEQQFTQLVNYREDYNHQFHAGADGVMQGATLNGYRAFLTGLNQAIEDQNRKVQQYQLKYEESAEQWHQTKSRCHALEKVTDKFKRLEKQDAAKHEQLAVDDLVSAIRH